MPPGSTLPRPRLQALLLDLLSPGREVRQPELDALDDRDWEAVLGMVQQHRLAPLLHRRVCRARADLRLPEAFTRALSRSLRPAAFRELRVRREMLELKRILGGAGVRFVLLKGAYLAHHAYANPVHRPLRDLDLLVPRDEALRAHAVLREAGYAFADEVAGRPEEALRWTKHLPPLRSPASDVKVEVHVSLVDPHRNGGAARDPADDTGMWNRCGTAPVAGVDLPFQATTDLLLHVILHAVVDHRFDNGPLVLADIGHLLDTHAIDWPLFWRLARDAGQVRACLLALRLAERYWPLRGVEYPGGEGADPGLGPDVLDAAALLLLRDFSTEAEARLERALEGSASARGRLGVLVDLAFPPRAKIAAAFPVLADSPAVYLWYPVWWSRLLSRLPGYLGARRNPDLQREVRQLATVDRWLAGGDASSGSGARGDAS